jgi:nicotinate-nucleotide adenylyltransferase
MVVLATKGEKTFISSLLEAPAEVSSGAAGRSRQIQPSVNYSVDTVRRLKQELKKSDELFFLIGMDAFNDIAKWHEAKALLRECPFIVASRPGYSLADVANALPDGLRPAAAVTKPFAKQPAKGDLVLNGVTVHLLDGFNHPVSATGVREAVAAKRPLGKLLDPEVAEYIRKMGLYKRGG